MVQYDSDKIVKCSFCGQNKTLDKVIDFMTIDDFMVCNDCRKLYNLDFTEKNVRAKLAELIKKGD